MQERYFVAEAFTAANYCSECGRPHTPKEKHGVEVTATHLNYGGHSVRMTIRMIQVMQQLLRTFPEPMPRERLFTNVWGDENNLSPKAVDVYVCRMRKILPPGLRIDTIHGVGFKLVRSVEN